MDIATPGTRIPAGYMERADGSLVPLANVKAEHLLEDELVRALHAEAAAISAQLRAFRERSFGQVDAFLELLAQKYETKRGGKKGNFSLTSFDGSVEIHVAVGDALAFGPELHSAKALIDECLTDWAEGSTDEIKVIVNDAFAVGKEGKLQVDRILGLRRLAITDPRWERAMTAIGDAIRVVRSKRYLRFYSRRDGDSPMAQLPLDLARV